VTSYTLLDLPPPLLLLAVVVLVLVLVLLPLAATFEYRREGE
jgi:hypothetical protein